VLGYALIFAAPGVGKKSEITHRDRGLSKFANERAEHVEKQGFHRQRHGLFIAHGNASCQSGGDVNTQNRECR
jgi:hypothetical protein